MGGESVLYCGLNTAFLVKALKGEFTGVSKPTEMTIRDLLQQELRKRGVTVVFD